MSFDFDLTELVALLLVSARVLAWSLVAPPMATAGVPRTIKVALSVAIGLAMIPVTKGSVPEIETLPILGSVLWQIVIGGGLGFLTRLLFTAIEMAGGLFDLFGGFALASAYDPLQTTMTTILGKFYAMLCTALIFATNAHLLIIQGFMRTFSAVPLNATISLDALGRTLTHAMTEMFIGSLQIAGPLIIVLFIADVGLGVLNRIAPQLNAFTLSFPIKIGLTLVLAGTGMSLLPGTVLQITSRVSDLIGAVVG
ncbi:MAG: flagellar biosynthetic protein FliR [Nakamurella sp.]